MTGDQKWWARIAEHVLSNVLAALVLLLMGWLAIALFTKSIPSPRILMTGLQSQPYLVWHFRAIPQERTRKSFFLLASPDKAISRFQLLVENNGEALSECAVITVDSPYKVLAVRAFGDVQMRNENGKWSDIWSEDQEIRRNNQRLEFRAPKLLPGMTLQIDIVVERDIVATWNFPPTRVSYEKGDAAMGLSVSEPRWR